MIKANKIVFKWHAQLRIFFSMSIEQQAGLLIVYM